MKILNNIDFNKNKIINNSPLEITGVLMLQI